MMHAVPHSQEWARYRYVNLSTNWRVLHGLVNKMVSDSLVVTHKSVTEDIYIWLNMPDWTRQCVADTCAPTMPLEINENKPPYMHDCLFHTLIYHTLSVTSQIRQNNWIIFWVDPWCLCIQWGNGIITGVGYTCSFSQGSSLYALWPTEIMFQECCL